jgi:hypothetical protein
LLTRQELIKQEEQLESEERETTERVWRTRRAILDKVSLASFSFYKRLSSNELHDSNKTLFVFGNSEAES